MIKNILSILFILLFKVVICQYDCYNNINDSANCQFFKTINNYTTLYIHKIPSPTTSTNGITFDGENIWVTSLDWTLYSVSPIDGSIKKELPVNISYGTGITFVDPYLWVVDGYNERICQVDTVNGSIINYFTIPAAELNGFPGGLTWDGDYLWYNSGGSFNDSTYKLSLEGEIIARYKTPFGSAKGITFDGTNLWSINMWTNNMYNISLPDFQFIDSICLPFENANGLAFDKQFLWVTNNITDSIYQLDVGLSSTQNNDSNEDDIKIWPIPTCDIVNIQSDLEIESIKIVSLDGKILDCFHYNFNDPILSIDIKDFELGIYIISIEINGEFLNHKIIKQK